MPRRKPLALLTRIEEIVLLVVWDLGAKAYGTRIRARSQRIVGRPLALGAVYGPLARLTERGLLRASWSEPTPVRGGRRKRFYHLTPRGLRALRKTRRATDRAWSAVREAE